MEGNKSYLMYLALFVIIGIIVVFFVIPNGGNKVLECHMENDETGIMNYWDVEVIYENGKMSKVNNLVKLDISEDYGRRASYEYSMKKDFGEYEELGFELDVYIEDKMVIAEMNGTKDTLNKDLVYYNNVKSLKKHFEKEGYICKLEELK